MLKSIKYHLKNQLPVDAVGAAPAEGAAETFITLSLKRSGQHAVINWLCYQLQDVAHFNHCYFERRGLRCRITPVNSRVILYKGSIKDDSGIQDQSSMHSFISNINDYKHQLYSFEDYDIEHKLIQKFVIKNNSTVLLIIRDPYNWLASTLKRKDCSDKLLNKKIILLIKYLEQALHIKNYSPCPITAINYNRWATQIEYRKEICGSLNIPFSESADSSVMEIPAFGGGSSFSGTAPIQNKSKTDYFQRWEEYASDLFYQQLLNNKYLEELTESYFQIKKPY